MCFRIQASEGSTYITDDGGESPDVVKLLQNQVAELKADKRELKADKRELIRIMKTDKRELTTDKKELKRQVQEQDEEISWLRGTMKTRAAAEKCEMRIKKALKKVCMRCLNWRVLL